MFVVNTPIRRTASAASSRHVSIERSMACRYATSSPRQPRRGCIVAASARSHVRSTSVRRSDRNSRTDGNSDEGMRISISEPHGMESA
jgi:hypothetical protein